MGWSRAAHAGAFVSRQPEQLTHDEWEQMIRPRVWRESQGLRKLMLRDRARRARNSPVGYSDLIDSGALGWQIPVVTAGERRFERWAAVQTIRLSADGNGEPFALPGRMDMVSGGGVIQQQPLKAEEKIIDCLRSCPRVKGDDAWHGHMEIINIPLCMAHFVLQGLLLQAPRRNQLVAAQTTAA